MYSLAIHIGLRNKHWLDILVVFVMLIPTSPPPSSGPTEVIYHDVSDLHGLLLHVVLAEHIALNHQTT